MIPMSFYFKNIYIYIYHSLLHYGFRPEVTSIAKSVHMYRYNIIIVIFKLYNI